MVQEYSHWILSLEVEVGENGTGVNNHRWNPRTWEGFLKNRKNWEGREDVQILVKDSRKWLFTTVHVLHDIGHRKNTKTSARDCSSHYASATISLQLFWCELKIALSLLSNLSQDSVSHYQIQWLSAHDTFLFQLMGFDGLARFIPWGINSLFTRKWKSVSPRYFSLFFVLAR